MESGSRQAARNRNNSTEQKALTARGHFAFDIVLARLPVYRTGAKQSLPDGIAVLCTRRLIVPRAARYVPVPAIHSLEPWYHRELYEYVAAAHTRGSSPDRPFHSQLASLWNTRICVRLRLHRSATRHSHVNRD